MPMSDYCTNIRRKIGNQLIFCPSVVEITIIRNKRNQILFVQEAGKTMWGLPAGAIELGETPAQAVVREVEVWEETGLQVVPTHLLGVFGGEKCRWINPDGNQVEYLNFVFACTVKGGTLQAVDGEIGNFAFYDPSSLPPLQFPYPKELFCPNPNPRTFFQRSE
ncbi:NUDIX domain-containing protein [Alicyclobacillus kakegawensis]|uniref:NUDIX domain-containing protein n=1 Tax=Alicyclobacillus kakegawensis TaxID=392012 RepID=UPI0009FAC479|nr:NUDIX domain-containing protein [Alicyclobacillus kakegawensis]